MTAYPAAPSAVDIKRHGMALATAIHKVRSDGTTVAPFKGGLFRVGDGAAMEVVSAAGIHGIAAKIDEKRQYAKERLLAPRTKRPPVPDAPAGESAGTPEASRAGSALAIPSPPTAASNPFDSRAASGEEGRDEPVRPGSAAVVALEPNAGAAGGADAPAPIRESRSPAFTTSDSTEPVVPAGNEGRSGERDASAPGDQPKVSAAAKRPAKPVCSADQPTDLPAPSVTCPCGRKSGHGGRCWFMRGDAGPPPTRRKPMPGGVCASCNGPRSYSAAGDLCRKCFLSRRREPTGLAARVGALEAELAEFKAAVKAAFGDVVAHLGLGQGR